MTIEIADWDTEQEAITKIRQQVFVVEQSVPQHLEWDGHDDEASHWLACIDGKAVATARLLPDGHIGRMAVLKAYRRQGLGQQLLATVIAAAKQRQLFEVYLYAQQHAVPFYEKAGFKLESDAFMDAGITHYSMRLRLAERRLLGIHGGKFGIRDLGDAVGELIAQADRQVRILSFDLDKKVYEQPELLEKLSNLARKSRFSEIKILIASSEKIIGRGHQLVTLQQRLSSAIKIRKFEIESEYIKNNLVIADSLGVICQSIKEPDVVWGNYNNRPIAEDFSVQFDRVWGRAKPDPNLRPVAI